MRDIILKANRKSTLRTFGINHGLLVEYTDDDGSTKYTEAGGVSWDWWASTGKLQTKAGTYNADGSEITAPTYAAGFVGLLRLTGVHKELIQTIKDQGVVGKTGTINYIELEGVRLYRASDVFSFLSSRGLPKHGYLGGDKYES